MLPARSATRRRRAPATKSLLGKQSHRAAGALEQDPVRGRAADAIGMVKRLLDRSLFRHLGPAARLVVFHWPGDEALAFEADIPVHVDALQQRVDSAPRDRNRNA